MPDTIFTEHNKSTPVNFQNNLFFGEVLGSDPGTYVVQVAPMGQRNRAVIQGLPLSTTMAHMLGFKETSLPQVGAYCLCYPASANLCVILGTVPKPDELSLIGQMPNRTILGAGDAIQDSAHTQGYSGDVTKLMGLNMQRPTDVIAGEQVIGNEFGVLLGLFQQFATLKASELAQVQTHVLDDLVRIVSHNFQHYTCLGEFKVFHDGKRMHLEAGMTDSPREALGVPEVPEIGFRQTITHEGGHTVDDKVDFYKLEDERLQAIERLKVFIGTLGDFINIMLVMPPSEPSVSRTLDGSTVDLFDRGLFNVQVHKDGGLHVRSVKGISLEKTNWIRVPHRIRSPEDPEGDDGGAIEYEEKDRFAFDDKFRYEEQPFLYFLQIRDYLAYIQEEYAFKNFKRHEKDFQINDDYSKEAPLSLIRKVDPFTEVKYEKKTAGIHLMPNGGISLMDAWGSAIILEGGNIYLQPAQDLVMQPLRSLVGKVGKFVNIAAKKDIDFSSTEGSYRLKTEKSQYLYSNTSGIVLHAEGETSADFFPKAEDDAVEGVSGIVMKSPNSGLFSYSKYKTERVTERCLTYHKEWIAKVDRGFTLSADDDIVLETTGSIALGADESIIAAAGTSAVFLGKNSTIVGLKDQTFGVARFGPFGRLPVQGLIKPDDIKSLYEFNDNITEIDVLNFSPNFRKDADFEALKFRYLKSDRYGITNQDVIPQTLAQQEDTSFETHGLTPWEEVEVNNTFPYPGKDLANSYVVAPMLNMERADASAEIHNRAVDNEPSSTLGEPIDIFQYYPVKN